MNQTNTEKLFTYISLLLHGKNIPPEAQDYNLTGEWQDVKEFHISGDLLVLYRKDEKLKEIQLLRDRKYKYF